MLLLLHEVGLEVLEVLRHMTGAEVPRHQLIHSLSPHIARYFFDKFLMFYLESGPSGTATCSTSRNKSPRRLI